MATIKESYMNDWYVLTGGPCAGKTTLIEALEAQGHPVVPEGARIWIDQGLAAGKTIEQIRADEIGFQRDVLRLKVQMEKELPRDARIFFDRGMHDSRAYLEVHGVFHDPELTAALAVSVYAKVFLLDLLPFETDGARTESPQKAREIHERLGAVYEEAGIPVVRVPVLSVPERVAYIFSKI